MDATYKLNLNEFPVLILGLSDAQQQFHLLSTSVLLHHTKAVYCEVLRVFQRVIMHVVPDISFPPQYGVTDCDAAERYSDVWYISRYVYRIEFCNWFHNCFSSSICFLFITCRDAVIGFFPRGNTPYVQLPCGEELRKKNPFLCQGCAAGHSE